MKIKDLKSVLYSTTGSIQFAILYDSESNKDIVQGSSVDYIVHNYGDKELRHIQAFENQLILTI